MNNVSLTRSWAKGVTVIELMLTIVVAAIILSIAFPDFTTLTQNKRISAQSNEFLTSLALARSEALKRVGRVTMCKSANGSTCVSSGTWEQGWVIFEDLNNNAQRNSENNEPIIRVFPALEGGNVLKGSSNVADYISYVSSGQTKLTSGAFQSGTLLLCDSRGATHGKTIAVSVTGRSRVETSAPASCDH